MWKLQDFSVIQILREINFGENRSAKTAGFGHFRGSRCVKMAYFALLVESNLISRKI